MNPGTEVHVRDRVMTSCITGTVTDQPAVLPVYPGRAVRDTETLWIKVGDHRLYAVAVDHLHRPEDCNVGRR